MRRAVFLDRDGVINRAVVRDGKPYPPATLSAVEILPGVREAMLALHQQGFMIVVVTNQPDVARGKTPREQVEAINAFLQKELPIDDFRTCFHDSGDGCHCRKPLPGALLDAAKVHTIDLGASYMVGDRWRDTEAGAKAGCTTILVDYNYSEKRPEMVDFRVTSLTEAAAIILGKEHEKS